MPITLTLKDVPDEVYERLKVAADVHRRSVEDEATVCLESVLTLARVNVEECLARTRALRATLKGNFTARDIDRFKRERRRR